MVFQLELTTGEKCEIQTVAIDKAELEFEWVKKRDPNNSQHINTMDMTSLTFLNEAEIIECMKIRFQGKKIYTNTGPILMAINPFERLPIYTPEVLEKYYSTQAESSLGPHVYQMSDRAYRKMFVDRFDASKRENQTILVNGESGAGKTEATKQVLKYLSYVSSRVASNLGLGATSTDVENQIIASNPITESFGNAKTSRNNNSSRFGKFIELGYAPDGYIEGATIRTYLLETVRIVKQVKGERNYHIFL
jgi:myosin heavy subunit